MTAPAEPHILADTGGLAVSQEGDRVIVFDRGTGALSVLMFVVGVLAAVLIVNGILALFGWTAIGLLFLALGFAAVAGTVMLFRKFRARRALPLHSCRTVAVLDGRRGLFSAAGGALQELGRVQFERRFQLGSSSPKLVAITPAGTTVLKRGNPFDGGIGQADAVLNDAVVRFTPGFRAPEGS